MEKGEPLAEPEAGRGAICQREGVSGEPIPTFSRRSLPQPKPGAHGGPVGQGAALHGMRGGLGQEPASLSWLRAPSRPAPAESRALISGGAAGQTAGTGARAPPKAWATPGALGSGEALQTSTHLPISKNQSGRTPSHRPHECQPHFPPLGTSVSPAPPLSPSLHPQARDSEGAGALGNTPPRGTPSAQRAPHPTPHLSSLPEMDWDEGCMQPEARTEAPACC